MAELEILKHAKKSYTILKSTGKDWGHKLKEIIIEILIIVFAVSISIWFHNWSEKRHEDKEEKEFFIGFRKDLGNDIENMTASKTYYEHTLAGIQYFLKNGDSREINRDSLNKYLDIFFGSTDLDPHISRYEGLKSSGKFRIIENKELLNNIISLHESLIQRIQELNLKYYQDNEKLETLIIQNARLLPNGKIANASMITKRSDFKILLTLKQGLVEYNIIPAAGLGLTKCKEIQTQIDDELK